MAYDIDSIRSSLTKGELLRQRSTSQYDRLRSLAESRQQIVQQEINRLAPLALTDPEASRRYRALVLENGQLARVLIQQGLPTT